jgi:hypothetical protein
MLCAPNPPASRRPGPEAVRSANIAHGLPVGDLQGVRVNAAIGGTTLRMQLHVAHGGEEQTKRHETNSPSLIVMSRRRSSGTACSLVSAEARSDLT